MAYTYDKREALTCCRCRKYKDDFLCLNEACRYFISYLEYGNCVLRVDKPQSAIKIGMALGITRQSVGVILRRALLHFRSGFVTSCTIKDVQMLLIEYKRVDNQAINMVSVLADDSDVDRSGDEDENEKD